MRYGLKAELLHIWRAESAASPTAPTYLNQAMNGSTPDVRYLIDAWHSPFYYPRQFLARQYRFKHRGHTKFSFSQMDIINIQLVHNRLICQLPCRFASCHHYLLSHHRLFHQFKELHTVVGRTGIYHLNELRSWWIDA